MIEVLVVAYLAIVFLIIFFPVISTHKKKKRQQEFSEKLPTVRRMVADGHYDEALEILTKEPVFFWQYKLESSQREEVNELLVRCLVELSRIEEAVISLASHLSSAYLIEQWPTDLLTKWIALYKSCDPIDVEKFYFCQSCGLHPAAERLLTYAIEKEGCNPPLGFPGKAGSAVIIEWGGRKLENKEK